MLILERTAARDLETRIQAVVALRDLHGREIHEALSRLSSDACDVVRAQTVMVLGMRRDSESRSLLHQMGQRDPSEAIRIEALSAIASRPDDQSRAVLKRAAEEDGSDNVRRFAKERFESLD
jgi:HEAT repeat protein